MTEPHVVNHPEVQDRCRSMVEATVAYGDRWFDPALSLLWNPAGSLRAEGVDDRTVHQLPPSGWYALGLLMRDRPEDRARAVAVLHAICDRQYDAPGTEWHGTFTQFAESPEPGPGAIMWFDFDPNWRQFLGTTFLLVLRHFEAALPADLIARLDRALRLAVEGETDRVTAGYSNIALMKAVLEVEAGERLGERSWVERGHALAEGIDERYSFIGGFDEFNSPTYYGVDLLGLGMWRTCPVSEPLRAMGALLERRLWGDVWDLYHPRLRNLCGPFSRAYGMDMNRYVAGLALWMWPRVGRAAAPLPDWERADRVDHGHDLLKGPAVALLTEGLGEPLDEELTEFRGARSVDRLLGGRRRITAWLGERTMVGGESGSHSFANLQFCPATLHWMRPDGGVGTIRLVHDGPVRAVATSGRLTIECDPHPFDGAKDPGLLVEPLVDPAGIAGDRWALPGLDLRVEAETDLVAAEPFGEALLVAYRGGPETVRISLIIEDSATS